MVEEVKKEACKVKGCTSEVRAKSYCRRHFKKWRQGELPKPQYKTCKQEDCKKPLGQGMKGYCPAHYKAWSASRKNRQGKEATAAAAAPEKAPETKESPGQAGGPPPANP